MSKRSRIGVNYHFGRHSWEHGKCLENGRFLYGSLGMVVGLPGRENKAASPSEHDRLGIGKKIALDIQGYTHSSWVPSSRGEFVRIRHLWYIQCSRILPNKNILSKQKDPGVQVEPFASQLWANAESTNISIPAECK